jgi:hypothetical protein
MSEKNYAEMVEGLKGSEMTLTFLLCFKEEGILKAMQNIISGRPLPDHKDQFCDAGGNLNLRALTSYYMLDEKEKALFKSYVTDCFIQLNDRECTNILFQIIQFLPDVAKKVAVQLNILQSLKMEPEEFQEKMFGCDKLVKE